MLTYCKTKCLLITLLKLKHIFQKKFKEFSQNFDTENFFKKILKFKTFFKNFEIKFFFLNFEINFFFLNFEIKFFF